MLGGISSEHFLIVAEFSHGHAVFLAEQLGCPGDVVKAAFKQDVGDAVVTVFEHIGDKGETEVVDKLRNRLSGVFFESTGDVLTGAIG